MAVVIAAATSTANPVHRYTRVCLYMYANVEKKLVSPIEMLQLPLSLYAALEKNYKKNCVVINLRFSSNCVSVCVFHSSNIEIE